MPALDRSAAEAAQVIAVALEGAGLPYAIGGALGDDIVAQYGPRSPEG